MTSYIVLVAVIVSGLSVLVLERKEDLKDRAKTTFHVVIFLSAAVAAILAVIEAQDASRFEDEMRAQVRRRELFESQVRRFNTDRLHFETELRRFESRRADFEKEMREATEQRAAAELDLQRRTAEVAASVVGGESFAYVMFSPDQPASTNAMVFLVTSGEYPLYDLHLRIFDLQRFEEVKSEVEARGAKWTYDDFTKAEYSIAVGNVAPGAGGVLATRFAFDPAKQRSFNIFFTARNGFWTQLLRMRKTETGWISAQRVVRNERVIYEQIDSEFPRNEEGEVEWD